MGKVISRIISHRGNLNGPTPNIENSPYAIDTVLNLGLDCEVDVWYELDSHSWWLGHDEPMYEVELEWLTKRKDNLWIHAKSIDTFHTLDCMDTDLNFFWHDTDAIIRTSKDYLWTTHPEYVSPSTVLMCVTLEDTLLAKVSVTNFYTYCTDYIFT